MVPSAPVTHRGNRRTEDAVASSTELVAFASDPVTGKGPREPGGMFPKKLLHGPLSPSSEPVEPEDPVYPVDPEEPVEPVEPVESADWAAAWAGATVIASATTRGNAESRRGTELIRFTRETLPTSLGPARLSVT